MSDEEWNFKAKDDLIYIENITKTKSLEVWGRTYVDPKDFEEDKAEQLWKKGEPNGKGYFTLENSKWPKVLTAHKLNDFLIKGKITLR